MRCENNIHVQRHKTSMINEEWTKHKMMPLLSPFTTCMLSLLFRQMKWQMWRSRDCSGLFLYPRLNHTGSHRPTDSHSKPYLHRQKNIGFGIRTTQPAAILRITRKAAIHLWFKSPLMTCHRERQRSQGFPSTFCWRGHNDPLHMN